MTYQQMEEEALNLNMVEKAKLISSLLANLDKADKDIEAKWKDEADCRVEAVRSGDLETVSLEEVLGKYFK